MKIRKIYLGESVYCEFTGDSYILTNENQLGASNKIILSTKIINHLMDFKKHHEDEIRKDKANTYAPL